MKNDYGKVSALEKIGYGLGDTASNIVFQSVMMFMAFFYTDIFGISAAAMGTLFLVVRIVDAVTDPMMGALSDRTNTRWGKFRPYLLWLCVPFAVITVITFTTPPFGATGRLIYAYITYSLLMIIYTAINIPYCSLGGVITPDTNERVSLNSYRFFLATGGGVLVASTTMKLADWLGGGSQQKGFQLAMVVLGTLAIFMFLISFYSSKERVVQVSAKKTSLKEDIKILFSNDQFIIVALLNFVLLIAQVIRISTAIYYLKWFAGRADLTSWFLTTGMVAAMLGTMFATPLEKRLSKVKSYILIHILVVIFSAALFFVEKDQILLIFVLFSVVQFFSQMAVPILWAMMADTVDYGEYKTERRITGLVFSGVLFSLKLGMAVGGAVLGWLLAYYGYLGEAISQTPRAIQGIVTIFTLVPIIGYLMLILVVAWYKLDKKTCNKIREELEHRKELANQAG